MSEKSRAPITKTSTGLIEWTFLLFLAGKLGFGDTDVQSWSWWLVTAPLWAGFSVWLVLAALVALAKK